MKQLLKDLLTAYKYGLKTSTITTPVMVPTTPRPICKMTAALAGRKI
jgi:hypothetical protein